MSTTDKQKALSLANAILTRVEAPMKNQVRDAVETARLVVGLGIDDVQIGEDGEVILNFG